MFRRIRNRFVARTTETSLLIAMLMLSSRSVFAQVPTADQGIPPSPGNVAENPPVISLTPGTPPNPRAVALWKDKPLGQLKASISHNLAEDEKLSPAEAARLSQATSLMSEYGVYFSPIGDSRPWMLASYEWEAPMTRHLPLLFEEPNLERLGYKSSCRAEICGDEWIWTASDCLQPIISGVHFFGRVPLIPYLCGVDCPFEPIYTLGVDRPGSPVPYRKHWIPLSLRGAIYQAGATVGVLYILP